MWRFVIHGAESDLVLFEQGWENVQNQTSWALQHCLMPNVSPPEDSLQLSSPNINAPAALANESPSSPSDTITQTPRVDLQSAEPHEELIIDSISPTVLPDPDSPNNE